VSSVNSAGIYETTFIYDRKLVTTTCRILFMFLCEFVCSVNMHAWLIIFAVVRVQIIAMNLPVCLLVCLSARVSQKPHVETSRNFLRMLPVAVARFRCTRKSKESYLRGNSCQACRGSYIQFELDNPVTLRSQVQCMPRTYRALSLSTLVSIAQAVFL